MNDDQSVARNALFATLHTWKFTSVVDGAKGLLLPLVGGVVTGMQSGNWWQAGLIGLALLAFVVLITFLWHLIELRKERDLGQLRQAMDARLGRLEANLLRVESDFKLTSENDAWAMRLLMDEIDVRHRTETKRVDQVGVLAQHAARATHLLAHFDELYAVIDRNNAYRPRPIDYPLPHALSYDQRWTEEVAHVRRRFQEFPLPSLEAFPAAPVPPEDEVVMELGDEAFFRTVADKAAYLAHLGGVEATREVLDRMRMDLQAAERWTVLGVLAPLKNPR